MKLLTVIVTLTIALPTWASWKSQTRAVLKEYAYACQSTEVVIDSITPNQFILGRVQGLPTEAHEKFKVVFYVKTNIWYVHPYRYYEGQQEGYSYSNLDAAGGFKVKTVLRGLPSKELAAVLVPKSYKIRAHKLWLNPLLGFLGGVLKYKCSSVIIPGNGDF